jgi:lipopolysaccharide/colanic/teichoic acid biosynthesis glycosyltransferase
VLDLLLLLVLAPLVIPVSALIAFYIMLVSKGPVLFSQTSFGFNGAPFVCYKFRSMKVDACVRGHEKHLQNLMSSGAPMTKLDSSGDTRLIPGAAVLRASGLDELAQLLNVLRGDMSIVGPRPCLPYEFALYEEHHKVRLHSLPGITGYWQVNGKNETTFEEMVAMDVEYVRRQSPALDVSILFRTVFVLLRQLSGAVGGASARRSAASGNGGPAGPDMTHAHADN